MLIRDIRVVHQDMHVETKRGPIRVIHHVDQDPGQSALLDVRQRLSTLNRDQRQAIDVDGICPISGSLHRQWRLNHGRADVNERRKKKKGRTRLGSALLRLETSDPITVR